MKKYIIALSGVFIFLIVQKTKAQVAIGKQNITNSSVLLEFGTENKGIILPSVNTAPGASGGTFIFNTTKKAVEVWEGKNNGNLGDWTLLTDENQGVNHSFSNTGADVISNPAGVIIGADITAKPGVLVLESTTKALVLPQVANPHQNIKGTIAGTMVYDTTADMLAVYDGANWSYWK
ncbi:hypothetical protein ACFO4P_07625 [Epilithonimonas pallida]|uniref:Uncharacterized protein n=1 Tax=Epilithonimonas pallida TaxID=373671 RepID=A0ABY1R3V7_9FLAO|nr:hypothetical protein [Epilithonimonas pallida]SMP94185.1 hypothetical protein SAMN05421679_105267 [Epilithonimonas pallida]